MHSRFLEQRTISQGSIYAAPAAWNRRGDGRRSAYPNSFTYFPLSRKYIRVLSPLPFFCTGSWLFHFFSLSFFLWLLERDFFRIAILFRSSSIPSFRFLNRRADCCTLSFGEFFFLYFRDTVFLIVRISKFISKRAEQFLIVW